MACESIESSAAFRHELIERLGTEPLNLNDVVRTMLKAFGLKSTLVRLKVVIILLHSPAACPRKSLDIHTELETSTGMALRHLNTYDVLRRLAVQGVLEEHGRNTYLMTEAALASMLALVRERSIA